MASRVLSVAGGVPRGSDKVYLGDLGSAGLEWGFGRAGIYAGHAHRGFTEVLFAPASLVVRTPDDVVHRVPLFVCGPDTFFRPERLPDFWFLKFYRSSGDSSVGLPDKVQDPDERAPVRYAALSGGTVSCCYFDPRNGSSSRIRFVLSGAPEPVLDVWIGDDLFLSVGR